jgi:hypothetical protein
MPNMTNILPSLLLSSAYNSQPLRQRIAPVAIIKTAGNSIISSKVKNAPVAFSK